MPVPEAILSVERPKNTVVVMYGKNKNLFAVRERVGCTYDHGRRIPVTGKTIGHIIDGKYVPNDTGHVSVSQSPIDLKDWGAVVLCDRLASTLLKELTAVYDKNDALKIYCIAILRVCYPGIKDNELKGAYEESFLSEIYPNVAMSRNTVSKFWNDLGKAYSRICKYMCLRVAAIEKGHHIIIDGTLKSDESTVNSLSDYSRKARVKGTRDISVLYAYDLDAGEPVCSKCFPGNMLDATAYESFIKDNNISKGIIVGDKGFPSSSAKKQFAIHRDLHYMNPLKRDSRYIKQCNLLQYEGQLPEHGTILYKKAKVDGEEKWLYSFRDTAQAHKEDYGWLHNAQKNGIFSNNQYMEDWLLFGTIILESDLDMEASVAYKTYDCRWEIELVMRYYKQTCEFDETRVHDDYSVIGSEFCNFLSTVMTYRMLDAFEKADLFKKMTYKKILKILTRAKKVRVDGVNWVLITMNPSQVEILQDLDLLPKPVPKKRGRKPKNDV
jgi:hypothetical protein